MSSTVPSRGRAAAASASASAGAEVAGELQARLGVGGDPPRDPVGDVAGADHEADGDAGQALPGEADRGAHREAAGEDQDADEDRGARGERPGRGQRQQPVEGEGAEGAGRDQRRQLVEGAVADAAVVVVVEAVELDDQDPDRAEEHRPEEGRDVGAGGRRGRDAERGDHRQPVAGGEQAAQLGAALARALGAVDEPRARRPSRRLGRRPARCAGRDLAPPVSFAFCAIIPRRLGAAARADSVRAPFRGRRGRRPLRRRPPRPSSAARRAPSCRPRVRSPG